MATFWSGRPGWLGKLGIALLATWLLILIISVLHVFKTNSISSQDGNPTNKENAQRLAQMINDFEILKKQNDGLKNIILRDGVKSIQGDHLGSVQERADRASIYYDLLDQHVGSKHIPSLEYEELRRRIRNNVQEMWYYMSAELTKFKKHLDEFTLEQKEKEVQDAVSNIWEHKKSLIMDLDRLTKADGYNDWRKKEAKELSDLVQSRFRYLQNPTDCNKAKKLICSLNKGCGFGCQIHHITYCFLVAYGTERTLVIKSKGWRYRKEGWESVFKPLSDTCLSTNGVSHANWPGDPSKQVISLPIVDNVYPKPKFQPPSVPADIAERLKKLHGHPLVWWVGQVLKYLMRPQDSMQKVLDNAKEKLGFKKPIVGVHVRRTDKVGTEAAYHDIDEYMTKVDQYFDELETKPDVKRVFLASDDPKVITTARNRYPNYKIIGDPEIAETASVSKRYSDSSLQGIIIDIHLLSLCDYLVCTFSSQVCRVAYELMQTYYPDAYNKFASLDDIYYYGGQNSHPHVAILDHKPRKNGELELKTGDLIEVYGNHWDGYSKGYNTRTSMTGLFPSFKVKNPVDAVDFPKYPDIMLHENKNN
ncbi:alpha-(1,6)-fucosyltransferase [Vespa crabro]|uniref:alpha-(1,6)-fucosyltransferase n=1 Tax=Vespa crabro TaxID=7445 RepID=UPI001F01AB86|nr:alpha-(1,6)-fucosyltransferase [Vespa crabro]XP_046828937.1 alpha-(1,6)-fucosyltransferase [Vespa crabro]XP_046828947.1 alpha-(1,6)-fucosyltransferase [Vespa crabro]XP_046828958.1 alpha-(1,6)-fucosyltransferase [Vespa crabro]